MTLEHEGHELTIAWTDSLQKEKQRLVVELSRIGFIFKSLWLAHWGRFKRVTYDDATHFEGNGL